MKALPTDPWNWVKNRTLPLLVALLSLIVLHPLFVVDEEVNALFPLAFALIPLLGLVALGRWQRAIPLFVVAAGMVVWAGYFCSFRPSEISKSSLELVAFAYYAYATIAIGAVLLRSTAVLDDRVYGGLAVFLMSACMYATLHRHVSAIDPDAYWDTVTNRRAALGWDNALYFSFSTITTLGYGDYVPRSAWARAVTMLESTTGVFVTVVFIARLATTPVHAAAQHHPPA